MVQSYPLFKVQEFYIDPVEGSDAADGSQDHPYKTITHALTQVDGIVVLHLRPGHYSADSGETFPLVLPDNASLIGDVESQGNGIVIEGSGEFDSPSFARQQVTLLPGNGAQVRGITVTNPVAKGTGIWIESTTPAIASCTLIHCQREGVFVTGTASPVLLNNRLQHNAASGITLTRHAKGELRGNECQNTGFGIVISDYASPLVIDNQISANRSGMVLSGAACPVLRNNRIEANEGDGLAIFGNALPDLGNRHDPAGNSLHANGRFDLFNATTNRLISVGNRLNPMQVNGLIEFLPDRLAGLISSSQAPLQDAPGASPVLLPPPVLDAATAPSWADPFIQGLSAIRDLGQVLGDIVQPEAPLTRSDYAALVVRVFDLPAKHPEPTFCDLPDEPDAAAAIAQAVRTGLLSGFPDQTVRPAAPLTRLQILLRLVQALDLPPGHPGQLSCYRDRAQIPSHATTAIATATQRGLVVLSSLDGCLHPLKPVTGAEAVAMLYQALVAIGDARAIASPYIVAPDPMVAAFCDVQGHWADRMIRSVASQGWLGGSPDGRFEPDRPITWDDYATLLVRLFHLTAEPPTDLPEMPEASPAMRRVYQAGLIAPEDLLHEENRIQPHSNVLRIQVLQTLVRGLQLAGGDRALLSRYDDAETVPTEAIEAVVCATAHRLVVNYPTLRRLHPNQDATRADVAAMVYQALVYSGRSPAIRSAYIIDPDQPNQAQPNLSGAFTVVLDPGHGGSDPGAIGSGGFLPEKTVVLPIAQEIASLLTEQGVNVVLTRSTDQALDLPNRLQIAEQARASLAVSLHANAADQPDISGIEIYHAPASAESADLAHAIHRAVLTNLDSPDRGVRQAHFYLLHFASMPIIHLEVGFVTSPIDSTNLMDPEYRRFLAQAIASGIMQHAEVYGWV
jgi:parallel beta-helix repeat protein